MHVSAKSRGEARCHRLAVADCLVNPSCACPDQNETDEISQRFRIQGSSPPDGMSRTPSRRLRLNSSRLAGRLDCPDLVATSIRWGRNISSVLRLRVETPANIYYGDGGSRCSGETLSSVTADKIRSRVCCKPSVTWPEPQFNVFSLKPLTNAFRPAPFVFLRRPGKFLFQVSSLVHGYPEEVTSSAVGAFSR